MRPKVFFVEFADRLRADLQVKGRQPHNPHGGGNTYALETALGEDMLLTSVGWANSYYQSAEPYTDEWGVSWRSQPYTTPFGAGAYTEMTGHPLADERAVAAYQPPDPNRPELYVEAARTLAEHILNIPFQYHLTAAKTLVQMGVDMVWLGDDQHHYPDAL
jgi:uroporphyrinogen decarboxylase